MFNHAERYSPLRRAADFGFRCMKLLTEDAAFQQAASPVAPQIDSQPPDQKPCSDEVFQIYKQLYDYNRSTNLHAKVGFQMDVSPYTRLEEVSFDAAYGGERMTADLYIPRLGKPPYQTIIHFPGSGASLMPPTNYFAGALGYGKAGRAWVLPSLKYSYHRKPPGGNYDLTSIETHICWFRDIGRTIDYLETRPDEFDTNKVAYEGLSAGAVWGPVIAAFEPRIKAVVIWGAGLDRRLVPEFSHFNFAPRVKVPVLMQDGRYDPLAKDNSIKPLLDLLGTPAEEKQCKLYDTGHSVWMVSEARRDEIAFLDKCLGTNTPAK
jgi:cephalosporin-C deacetylase-like acetyl esterase